VIPNSADGADKRGLKAPARAAYGVSVGSGNVLPQWEDHDMTMTAEELWQGWLERWGDVYETDEERRAAYCGAKANLARLTEAADRRHNDGDGA
jgi:hypothetical protein